MKFPFCNNDSIQQFFMFIDLSSLEENARRDESLFGTVDKAQSYDIFNRENFNSVLYENTVLKATLAEMSIQLNKVSLQNSKQKSDYSTIANTAVAVQDACANTDDIDQSPLQTEVINNNSELAELVSIMTDGMALIKSTLMNEISQKHNDATAGR